MNKDMPNFGSITDETYGFCAITLCNMQKKIKVPNIYNNMTNENTAIGS
jgi:hypothetical protein